MKNGNGNGNSNGRSNGNGNGNGPSVNEQVYEILHVAFKRKRLIAALFLAVALPGLIATWSRRPTYVASGKVLIVSDRADVTIQPSDINSLATIKLNESTVNSEVHIIESRELLEQVVRGLTLASTGGGVFGIANAASDHEAIGNRVLRLARALKVTPIRASNVIEIGYPSSDPVLAAQVVNRVVDEYLSYHAMVHGQKGLSTFYEDQSRLLQAELRRAEQTLRDFSYREGMVSPAAQIQSAVTAVADLETVLRTVSTSIAGAEEKLRTISEQLTDQPSVMKRAQYLGVNPVVQQLSEELTDRQVDRVALLRKYTDADRHVRDNAEEIAEIESQLSETRREEPTIITQELVGSNPVYEARLLDLLKLEAELKENRAKRLVLEDELARNRRQLVLLKQKTLDFDHLDQEVQRRQATLELYEKRQQEARIGDAMDQEKLVNIEVVERPKLPLRQTDNRRAPLMLAILSGLVVALSGAFGM
ncbi:MAG: hypothetical protein A3J75_05465, partial [Acidobacteria bacterium RBG_16_68_9]